MWCNVQNGKMMAPAAMHAGTHIADGESTGSHKTLGTILRDPNVPSSVGQVVLSKYLAFEENWSYTTARYQVCNQLGKNNWFVDR